MCRMHWSSPAVAAAVLTLAAPPIAGQSAGGVECPPEVVIPGFSDPEDRTISRCKLDNVPGIVSTVADLPGPRYERQAHADLTVVVGPDGRVDSDLTRYLSFGVDTVFQRQMLEGLRRATFEVGRIGDAAVRYGFVLSVQTNLRADTVPERLSWRYVLGTPNDSLVGTWVPAPSEGPVTTDLFTSAARAVTRVLRDMQVLLPGLGHAYCILIDEPFSDVRDSVREALPYGGHLVSPGCEKEVRHRRYRLETPLRTGGGRTVVHASGDFLSSWPPGLDGRWWRTWEAYCVTLREAPSGTQCDVSPIFSGDAVEDGWTRDLFDAPPSDGPVAVALLVTTEGAHGLDTLRASIPDVPVLPEKAVVDVAPFCRGLATWQAYYDRPGAGEIIAYFRLPSDDWPSGYTTLTEVTQSSADARFRGVTCPEHDVSRETIALFTLGGVGEPLEDTVRFCVNEPGCARSYSIVPGRHELASEPHVRFRISDLREATRAGGKVRFRLHVDRTIDGLLPFVVIRGLEEQWVWLLRRRDERVFDFDVEYGPDLALGGEFWVYLTNCRGRLERELSPDLRQGGLVRPRFPPRPRSTEGVARAAHLVQRCKGIRDPGVASVPSHREVR